MVKGSLGKTKSEADRGLSKFWLERYLTLLACWGHPLAEDINRAENRDVRLRRIGRGFRAGTLRLRIRALEKFQEFRVSGGVAGLPQPSELVPYIDAALEKPEKAS